MATTRFADSPRNGAWGDRPYALIDFAGPASYTAVTNGSPPTGGQAIGPADFGMGAPLEGIFNVSGSTTGTYIAQAVQLTAYATGQPNKTWALRWIVAATGAEVTGTTNLSAETVRLVAFGPY